MKRRSFNMESVKELLNSDIYKGIFLLIFLLIWETIFIRQ